MSFGINKAISGTLHGDILIGRQHDGCVAGGVFTDGDRVSSLCIRRSERTECDLTDGTIVVQFNGGVVKAQ